jgi:transketolase
MKRFGQSAPAGQLFSRFGFTSDAIVAAARKFV